MLSVDQRRRVDRANMATSGGFEELINQFTYGRTGENVYLDLAKENVVELRPKGKRGSVSLGVFWVNVFQHPNNYPVTSFPYKKLYRAGSQYELQLRIDGLMVIFNLASGKLIIQGIHALDWFVNRFAGIMEGYSNPVENKGKDLGSQYSAEEMEALRIEREKMYKNYLEFWPLKALERAANIMEAGREDKYREPTDTDEFLKGEDLETYSPLADLLSSEETQDQLNHLKDGRSIQGNVLYRIWRSVLNVWFSDKDGKVLIVTPHIDRDRMTDLCMIFLHHKLTACIDTMCIPMSNLREKHGDLRTKTINRFPAKDQVIIEYKIFNNLVYPRVDFATSFMAFLKDDKASVLLTNVNFDCESFKSIAPATVQFNEMDVKQFFEDYVDPILA